METSLHLKYLAVNPQDALWGAAVNSVGYQDIEAGMPYPPSNHPSRYLFSSEKGRVLEEYQLLYITRGGGTFLSASLKEPVPVSAGTVFLLFPGEWHTYAPLRDTGWKEYWIGFKGFNTDSLVERGFFSKARPTFNIGLHNDIVELYANAIAVASAQESGFQPLLASIVGHIMGLVYFYDKNNAFASSEVNDLISKAKILIAENYKDITPEEIARRLNTGYSNFRKIFKAYTGFAPAKYIQDFRNNKVKEMITNSSAPIKEIAYSMGFENYEYFFTSFKRLTGRTPLEYRELTQGKKI